MVCVKTGNVWQLGTDWDSGKRSGVSLRQTVGKFREVLSGVTAVVAARMGSKSSSGEVFGASLRGGKFSRKLLTNRLRLKGWSWQPEAKRSLGKIDPAVWQDLSCIYFGSFRGFYLTHKEIHGVKA